MNSPLPSFVWVSEQTHGTKHVVKIIKPSPMSKTWTSLLLCPLPPTHIPQSSSRASCLHSPLCWALTSCLEHRSAELLSWETTEHSFPHNGALPTPRKEAPRCSVFQGAQGCGHTHCGFCGDHGGSDSDLLLEREGKNQNEGWLLTEQ